MGIIIHCHTWPECRSLISDGSFEALDQLGRTRDQYATYMAHRAKTLQRFATMQDYMRAKVFRLPLAKGEDGKLRVDDVAAAAVAPPPPHPIVLMCNEFPYYFQPDIEHLNIWATGELPAAEVERIIAERLRCKDYCWFVNPLELQSIEGVWHCHIFVHELEPLSRPPPLLPPVEPHGDGEVAGVGAPAAAAVVG